MMLRMVVVLPTPLRPSRQTHSPAFTAMEITERLVAGAPVGPLFGRLYVVGVATQFLVACVKILP